MTAATSVHVVDMVYVEVVSALRHILRRGDLEAERADVALDALMQLRLRRHSTRPLAGRIWALRSSHGAYDAAYVALAEALGALLVTTDSRLARSTGHRAVVIDANA